MKAEISEFNHLSSASFFKKPEPLAKIAVLIPCYNEELTIADVIQQDMQLTDEQWSVVQPLIPKPRRRPDGRDRISDPPRRSSPL